MVKLGEFITHCKTKINFWNRICRLLPQYISITQSWIILLQTHYKIQMPIFDRWNDFGNVLAKNWRITNTLNNWKTKCLLNLKKLWNVSATNLWITARSVFSSFARNLKISFCEEIRFPTTKTIDQPFSGQNKQFTMTCSFQILTFKSNFKLCVYFLRWRIIFRILRV